MKVVSLELSVFPGKTILNTGECYAFLRKFAKSLDKASRCLQGRHPKHWQALSSRWPRNAHIARARKSFHAHLTMIAYDSRKSL